MHVHKKQKNENKRFKLMLKDIFKFLVYYKKTIGLFSE